VHPNSSAAVEPENFADPLWHPSRDYWLSGRGISSSDGLVINIQHLPLVVQLVQIWTRRLDWDDYLRDEAQKYRKLAEQADDPLIKRELVELADVCDKVANNIEDHMTTG
jgi:hypothetical protein